MGRRILTHLGAFVAGVAVAATALSLAWAWSLDPFLDVVEASQLYEQEALERQARRHGDPLGELIHAGAGAYLADGIGLVWAERWRTATLTDRMRWPLDAYSLGSVVHDIDPEQIERGKRLVAATKYARLAWLAERQGLNSLPSDPWKRAKALAPALPEENLRELGHADYSDLYVDVDDPYLTARSFDELEQRLAEIRGDADTGVR